MEISSTDTILPHLNFFNIIAKPYSPVVSTSIFNMYSTQHIQMSPQSTEKMYSVNHSMNEEATMTDIKMPKKENIFQSMFNALTNMIGDLSRVPTSLLSNINSPLSVTVVQNDGIISHEFFKNLTHSKDSLLPNNTVVSKLERKELLNVAAKIQDNMSEEGKLCIADTVNPVIQLDDNCSQFRKYTIEHSVYNGEDLQIKESDIICTPSGTLGNTIIDYKHCGTDKNKIYTMLRQGDDTTEIYTAKKTISDWQKTEERDTTENQDGNNLRNGYTNLPQNNSAVASQTNTAVKGTKPDKPIGISTVLTDIWQKMFSEVTDRLYCKSETLESDSKKMHSPKQRRKLNTIANGKGRGRARSQLRRSGVSQTRRRKERVRHDLIVDIQDDFETWQDFDVYHTVQNTSLLDPYTLNEDEFESTSEIVVHNAASSTTFVLDEIKPVKQKPKTCKTHKQERLMFPKKVRYVPDCALNVKFFYQDYSDKKCNFAKDIFRPRLMSESSIDSEDSYCIVFETESEASYKNDFDYIETSDEDESCTEDLEMSTTVKFDLKPVVHTMVHWNYAYRAARKGPWEEMARDRERFRGRIHCLEHILSPVLTVQHRIRIWQERFKLDE